MKTVIEMAREAGLAPICEGCDVPDVSYAYESWDVELERFAELVRADERNSWPAEMEAMERQVNILTDALDDRQRWFDALEAQHKQAILAEREACAKMCAEYSAVGQIDEFDRGWLACAKNIATVIRARGEASIRSNT